MSMSNNPVSSPTPDNDVFRHLALIYSFNHRIMHLGKECDGLKSFPNGTTNGAAWYPLAGKSVCSINRTNRRSVESSVCPFVFDRSLDSMPDLCVHTLSNWPTEEKSFEIDDDPSFLKWSKVWPCRTGQGQPHLKTRQFYRLCTTFLSFSSFSDNSWTQINWSKLILLLHTHKQAECRITTICTAAVWSWPLSLAAANTRTNRNCLTSGLTIVNLCSPIWAKFIAVCADLRSIWMASRFPSEP